MISNNPFAKNDGTDPDWLERFVSYIEFADRLDCWIWKGGLKDKGKKQPYGALAIKNRGTIKAHRLAYELRYGVLPEDKPCVLHSCHNTLCVNFRHLRAGTHAENMKDKAEANRAFRMIGSSHSNAVLSDEQVIEIKTLLAEGKMAGVEIARLIGTTPSSVSVIRRGKQWSHIGTDIKPKEKPLIVKPPCPHCGSNRVKCSTIRKNKSGHKRVFKCEPCNRIFTPPNQV